MSNSQRRLAAAILFVALGAAAIVLVLGGRPVADFIAEVAGFETANAKVRGVESGAVSAPDDGSSGAAWDDPDDADDPDRAAFADRAVKPLRVRVVGTDGRPAGGVPVAVLRGDDASVPMAGPKYTNAEGRVRFPIDVAMEREPAIVVAARAMPGHAAAITVSVALDQPADAHLVVDCGIRAAVAVVDPEGRPAAGARVRKAILGEPRPESGPRAEALGAAFAESTPRGVRSRQGLELVGLSSPEEFTLLASAPGFAPVFHKVQVPLQASDPFAIEVRLDKRTSVVRLAAALPGDVDQSVATFSCHQVDPAGLVIAAGFDEAPEQKSPKFEVEVLPDTAHRLEVHAWVGALVVASADLDVPALRDGEVFDAGTVRLESLPVVLSGHVVDQDQGPLANATVEAIGRGAARDLAAHTGKDGAFSLRAPAGRGPYQVSAHAPGRVSERLSGVVDPAKDLRFVLDVSGGIQGSIVVPPGVDADRISVRAMAAGRSPFVTAPRRGGAFLLTGLPRGVYTVVIEGEGIDQLRISDVVVNPPETNSDGRLDQIRPRPQGAQGQP
jgi:hypothetical protein